MVEMPQFERSAFVIYKCLVKSARGKNNFQNRSQFGRNSARGKIWKILETLLIAQKGWKGSEAFRGTSLKFLENPENF